MIYRVTLDGSDIFGQTQSTCLLNTSVESQLNDAGSFEFTLPPMHSFYNAIDILNSDVEVYEADDLVWFGRPMEIKKDFYNQKTVYCEGALGYFNDSIQRPTTYTNTLLSDFFRALISVHNAQVPARRQFTIGRITITDKYVWRQTDYQNTLECLNQMCLDTDGGYLMLRREEGVNYIDWLGDLVDIGDQPVQFALNILDLSQELNGADICTCVLPLGATVEGTDQKLTISSVNDGVDTLEAAEGVETYGKITKVKEWSNISDAQTLKDKAASWLADEQYDHLTISVNAAELHYIYGTYNPFRVGQMVHVTSSPHLIDKNLPITSINLDLASAKKQITIGTPPRKDLSEIVALNMKG